MGDRQHLNRLGAAVRARRHALGYSQEELAERSGLHRNYIGGIERGERNVGYLNLTRLAEALRCRASRLVSDAEEMSPEGSEAMEA